MSMNFSEFKRLLGAEPRSRDPEFLHARQSSPEFEAAAAAAEQFEARLEQSMMIPGPDGLTEKLQSISQTTAGDAGHRRWWPLALAASVVIAVGAAGLTWNMNRGWDSVEEYVMDHYRHDGNRVMAMAGADETVNVQAILSELNVRAVPELAGIVGVIKYCPTPDGKGAHMILNTETGPVTVIYMPETEVTDREMLAFDDVQALLVALPGGSAAIIGPDQRQVSSLYGFIQQSIIPLAGKS